MPVVYQQEDGSIVITGDNNLSNYPQGSILAEDNELSIMRAQLILQTKFTARTKILNILPVWKQNNISARAIELVEKKVDGTITSTEQTELTTIRATWTNVIVPIRTASNNIEAEINGLTIENISQYRIQGNPLWPQNSE